MVHKRLFSSVFIGALLGSHLLIAQTLLVDEFDGTGLVNQSVWRLPFLDDGAFFGRTEVKTDRAIHYPTMQNGTIELQLDTFRDNGFGQSTGLFHGASLQTKRNFVVAGGLRYEVRSRLLEPIGGLDGGAFLFDVQRINPQGLLVRDEIDFELLSNSTNVVLTNFWDEGTFTGPDGGGTPLFVTPGPGFDITEFQVYRLDWFPDRMEWYVNETLVRVRETNIPDDPMNFRMNLWAPDSNFPAGFNEALQPANSAAENETYVHEVDRVEICQLNTIRSQNLLSDSSFENVGFPFSNLSSGANPDQSAVGQWIAFNNVSFSTSQANSGSRSLAMFGPFVGSPDASGVFQNVVANPGDVFEASVFCRTNGGNSILGEANFTTIKIEFLDTQGNIIPGLQPFLGANGKESVVLEGRDPSVPQNVWVQRHVNAIAPQGANKARVTLLFVQLENGSGAAFFDDLELVKLMAADFVPGDINQDGNVSLLDVVPFIELLSNNDFQIEADLNGDGLVNLLDVNPFVDLLAGN